MEISKSDYRFLLEEFDEDRIIDRYAWIYSMIEDYLALNNLTEYASVSEDILNHVVVDYFVDIYRLKPFQEIDLVHDSKIYSYMAFWLLRHKPIQIKTSENEENVFVNEEFVSDFLESYLFNNPASIGILKESQEAVDNFRKTMVYYFKYRDYSAKGIEMLILAFNADRGYQYSVDHKR